MVSVVRQVLLKFKQLNLLETLVLRFKRNAIEERKIQRLFRNGNVDTSYQKSNDFGAGGVCVAIGELQMVLKLI